MAQRARDAVEAAGEDGDDVRVGREVCMVCVCVYGVYVVRCDAVAVASGTGIEKTQKPIPPVLIPPITNQ